MNVLYLTDNPNLGGTIRVLQSWLPEARSVGIVPSVAVQPGSRFAGWLRSHQIATIETPMPWLSRSWPFPSMWHATRLALWARARRIELLHCNEHNVYPFALLVKHLLRVPIVCHARYMIGPPFARWAFAGRRQPDAFLWTSRAQWRDSMAAVEGTVSPSRQHLVPLGIDLARFGTRGSSRDDTRATWGFSRHDLVIGQACAIRPRKRIEDFLDLIARLRVRDPRVKGVLAGDAAPGDESYRTQMRERTERDPLKGHVLWLGNVDDIEPFYHAIDVFVSTSEYETFGNSVCESMACGRPVIGYVGGSVAEVVGEGGVTVPDKDVEALVQAVTTIIEDEPYRAALGEAAKARVAREFDPRRTLEYLRDLYTQLLMQAGDNARVNGHV